MRGAGALRSCLGVEISICQGRKTNKHKQFPGNECPGVGGGSNLSLWEKGKHINKIPRKSQEKVTGDSPGTIPGQSRENFAYVFPCLLVFFRALGPRSCLSVEFPYAILPKQTSKKFCCGTLQTSEKSLRDQKLFRAEACLSTVLWGYSAIGVPYLGNGPNTVSESTVSNTELSEFFGSQQVLGRELSEFLSAYD